VSDQADIRKLYHLKGNPFESRVRPDAPLAGRTKEQKAWRAAVTDRLESRAASLSFVVGDYGMGKTHSLWHIKADAEESKGVTAIFMKLLTEDTAKNFGRDFIRRIFKHLDANVRDKLARAKPLPPSHPLYEHSKTIKQYAANVAWFRDLLTGADISKTEIRKHGLHHWPHNTEMSLEFLAVLLHMLADVGISTLVLCVDEAEYVFSQSSDKKAALVFNALRSIYDLTETPNLGKLFDKTANIIMFFAMSVDGWNKLSEMQKTEVHQGGPIQPLLTRRNALIMLSRLTKVETDDMIRLYLRTDRTTGKVQNDPLIPYDEDFVGYVYDLAKGHPRETIQRCDYVLTAGLRDNEKRITKKYAKAVYLKMGLAAE